jgi:hypothetical protein
MAPKMPSKPPKSKGPKPTGRAGFVKPASAAQNKKNPPKVASAVKKMVPIKKPGSNVINVSSKPTYISGSAPSGGSLSSYMPASVPSMPSTPSASSTPQIPSSGPDRVYESIARDFMGAFESVRNAPTSTTNGMTGVDAYKGKSLKSFMDFNF